MYRFAPLILFIVTLILSACGSPAPASTVPTTESGPVEAVVTTVGIMSTLEPTTASTSIPTVAPTLEPTTEASVLQAYKTLVLLKGTVVMIEDALEQPAPQGAEGLGQALGQTIATGAFIKVIGEALDEPPSSSVFAEAWEQGRAAHSELSALYKKRLDKEIDSEAFATQLTPISAKIDTAIDTAEIAMSAAYGFDIGEMHQRREQALQQMRDSLQASPTPKP